MGGLDLACFLLIKNIGPPAILGTSQAASTNKINGTYYICHGYLLLLVKDLRQHNKT
jgi:hypothetical protein